MGYTTEFDGQFTLVPAPSAEIVLRLYDLDFADRDDFDDPNMPESYNQWQLTKDRQHLAWDGNEKFYHYVEWLQYLIDHVLMPAGITLTGEVSYSGEDVRDTGVLTIQEGRVCKVKHTLVSMETLEALQDFRNFVLASDYGDELLREWQRKHRQQKA